MNINKDIINYIYTQFKYWSEKIQNIFIRVVEKINEIVKPRAKDTQIPQILSQNISNRDITTESKPAASTILDDEYQPEICDVIKAKLIEIQTVRQKDLFIPATRCLPTDYAQILANFIIDDEGYINQKVVKAIIKRPLREGSFVHGEYILRILKKLSKDLGNRLLAITSPKNQNSKSATFIRMAIGKNIDEPLTDVDVRRAAMVCLLDELYQEEITGSCYTTSLAMNVRSQYPELFIDDLKNIIDHGHYTRMINNKPYVFFPMLKTLDENLENGIFKKRTLIQGDQESIYCLNKRNVKRPINKEAFYSLLNAFQSANINISTEEIIEITNEMLRESEQFFYKDKNNKTIPIDKSKIKEFLEENKGEEISIIKSETYSLKKIIQAILLKHFNSTLSEIKENHSKYEEYSKLKDWVQQNFSNNQVNRLLRSWEYSLGTATLDTTTNINFSYNRPKELGLYVVRVIITLFDLDTQFNELKEKLSIGKFSQFLDNFHRLIDEKIGLIFNKGIYTLFDKTNLLDYEDKKRISTLRELQELVSSIIIKSANKFPKKYENLITNLAEYILDNQQKDRIISTLQTINASTDTSLSGLIKQFLRGGTLAEPTSNYCGRDVSVIDARFFIPTSAENLLNKLITEIKIQFKNQQITMQALKKGFLRIPVGIHRHAFALTPNQQFFQDAVNWKGSTEVFLENNLKSETTVTIADLNYEDQGKHIFIGIQKTSMNQYKIVHVVDDENIYSRNPTVSSEKVDPENYLGEKWQIYPRFNEGLISIMVSI